MQVGETGRGGRERMAGERMAGERRANERMVGERRARERITGERMAGGGGVIRTAGR